MLLQTKELTSYYRANDDKLNELITSMAELKFKDAGMKKAVVGAFPWTSKLEVDKFVARGDMSALRLRLTNTTFRTIKSFASDIITAVFSTSLIAHTYTWPSRQ